MGTVRRDSFGVLISLVVALALALAAAVDDAGAQSYPVKSVSIIVPFPAGGSTDIAVRNIIPYVAKYLKASVQIENAPGADGIIGYNKAYSSKPDGATVLAQNTITLFLAEYSRETKFKTLDFKPVFAFARDSVVLVVHPDVAKNFEEFNKMAHAQTVTIGTTGSATTTGLVTLLLADTLKWKVNWIPFDGGGESMTACAGKHVDAVSSIAASAYSLSKAGKLRPILLVAERRNAKYPDVPVPKELGLDVPLLFNHTGIVAPPGFSADKVKMLEDAFKKAVEDPEYLEKLRATATSDLIPLNAVEYAKEFERLQTITEKYRKQLRH